MMTDCDTPSRGSRSGVAVAVTDSANPEGPVRLGPSPLSSAQPTAQRLASTTTAARRSGTPNAIFIIILCLLGVCEIAELDADAPAGGDLPAGLVMAEEGHLGERRDDGPVDVVVLVPEAQQRGLQLGGMPDQFERCGRRRAAWRDG